MEDPDLDPDDASAKFLLASRFWIQKVFVPMAVFIGVCGNIITVMVLTRRRMRCTTTIYLTALAVADIVYLLFVLLLSMEKYDRIHERKFELYWRFFGITHWLCDAASSTSVWLTVSFTIERYIVVCHPIKGKVHCTEARAKNIITVVSILCLISTASTTFEYQLKLDEKCVRKTCNDTISNGSSIMAPLHYGSLNDGPASEENVTIDRWNPDNGTSDLDVPQVRRDAKKTSCENTDSDESSVACAKNDTECLQQALNTTTCCEMVYLIDTEATALAHNSLYTTIFYWFSSIGFGLLPLVLIATFNSFLVHAVYRSQRQRRRLTNSQETSSQNNENRITLLLISVVILFLICQTPTAVYLIYAALHRTDDEFSMNIEKGLGNIFNFLVTLNASCNFILYCMISAKFRRTFHIVFCQRKANPASGLTTIGGSSLLRHSRYNNSTACNTAQNSRRRGGGGGGGVGRGTATSGLGAVTNVTNLSSGGGTSDEEVELLQEREGGGVNGESGVGNGVGNRVVNQGMKTPRSIETLSFNSVPRSNPLMMRPLGKARSTDLVV